LVGQRIDPLQPRNAAVRLRHYPAMVPPAELRVRLLGQLDLRLGDAELTPLESARAESLLAYLLLHRDAAQPRQQLAFVLWPDSTEPQARTNLRHVLHNLRRALPDADRYLEVTPRTLRWRPDAPLELDVAVFEEALAQAADDDVQALRQAVDAYTGDLLEGSYDEWLLEERERLRQLHLDALDRLARRLAERGDTGAAIEYSERLLRLDPLREETCRLLMRLHDERGDRARALRVYHACAAALDRQLGAEPGRPTVELYEALLPGAAAAAPQAEAPSVLVGRSAERTRLIELWRASEAGRAALVLITGEPGIGKTRLVEELSTWCAQRGVAVAEARSYPAEGALAYAPVAAWLRADALLARRVRLDRRRLTELARVLPEIALTPEPLPEGEQRRRLFDAIAAAILGGGGPLLLVADDLHWADRETLQFLHYLLRSAADAPLLVAATARSEEIDGALAELVTALRTTDRAEELELARLSREETAVLAGPDADAERLYRETEGNPLFVVEALRAGWSRPHGALSPRVQAVIEARLGQLSEPARELVDVAAAIGREFTVETLERATDADEEALVRGLDELWRRRVVADHGPSAYDFTHDKIREVAYRGQSPPRRRRNHLRVARALEALHAGDATPVAGEIAVQYDRAGAPEDAVAWYQRAADAALGLYANVDALALLERALALVSDPERELQLITTSLATLGNVEGYGSSRLQERHRRALELSGDPDPVLLRSLAVGALTRGEFDEATAHGERLLERAERDRDAVLHLEARYVLGIAAFWRVDLQAARSHFEIAVAEYRPEHRTTHLVRYGLDPQVVCLSRLANTLGFLGEHDAAIAARRRALALADEIAHEPTRLTATVFAALLALDLGDAEGVRRYTEALAGGSPDVRAAAVSHECLAGYLQVLDGEAARGLRRIRRELDDLSGPGHAPGNRASLARVLIEACAAAGDAQAGLEATELPVGVALWEPETLAARAGFLAALGAPAHEVDALRHAAAEARNARGTPR
jgi:DNA-binding SARP family transcriptional activator